MENKPEENMLNYAYQNVRRLNEILQSLPQTGNSKLREIQEKLLEVASVMVNMKRDPEGQQGQANQLVLRENIQAEGAVGRPPLQENVPAEGAVGPPPLQESVPVEGAVGPLPLKEKVPVGRAEGPPALQENVPVGGAEEPPALQENVPVGGAEEPPALQENVPVGGAEGPPALQENVPVAGAEGPLTLQENVPAGGAEGTPALQKNVPVGGAEGQLQTVTASNNPHLWFSPGEKIKDTAGIPKEYTKIKSEYFCPVNGCDEKRRNLNPMYSHIREEHTGLLHCRECPELKFSSAGGLRYHMMTHERNEGRNSVGNTNVSINIVTGR